MSKKFHAYRRPVANTYRSFPLVAIGASTGGLQAAMVLFSFLPVDSGLSFLYLQHADQTQKTDIISSLESVTRMPVVQALDGMPVLPDHIYIVPPGKGTTIRNDNFVITRLPDKPLYRMPVDRLFTSLANDHPANLSGILLSGVTHDGTLGMQAIKSAGGHTIVQDGSALFNYMPRSAVVAGVADQVLSPQQMAEALLQLPRRQPVRSTPMVQHTQRLTTFQKPPTVKPPPVEHRPQPRQQSAVDTHELNYTKKLLQRVRDDLEQFAYVSGHDLQEPLRKIFTYSDLLQQRFDSLLPDAGKEYIEKIKSSALHMTQLLGDLLNFSRISGENETFKPVDLNDVVERVLVSLHDRIQQKQAGISYWALPTIEGIPGQLEMLFYHLVDNTLKFAHPRRPPEVTITSKPLPAAELQQYDQLDPLLTYYDIVVSDNGIGFREEYARQIFVIFQRLNDKHEYPGSGIGLSVCRKITGIHQGEVYATSKEGEGSFFHVLLPARQP